MALKGTTRIELTNVKTGEKEVIEKDNLVTNAVASILGENPFAWQLKSSYASNQFAGNMLPLCPNLFGGILLYENSIPEEVNRLYAQPDNPLVGYSSNNVNDKTDTMRGSMNLNESGVLESNDGYRYVFDFTTSQANGTISSVGLTSKWGGIAGYGSMDFRNTQSPNIRYEHGAVDSLFAYAYHTLLHYNPDTGVATSVYVSGMGTITVTRIRLHTQMWKLTGTLELLDKTQIVDTQIIETATFAKTASSKALLYHNFCNGGDGYIWGFEHANGEEGNSSGKATINWIKIKIDDMSIDEGTWEIDAQIYKMGNRRNFASNSNSSLGDRANCVVLDGFLYCINYTRTGLYKIDLSNITNIKFIEHPDGVVYDYTNYQSAQYVLYSIAPLVVSGNRVCMFNGYVNGDTIVPCAHLAYMYAKHDNYLCDTWLNSPNNDNGYPFRNSAGLCGLDLGPMSLYFQAGQSSYSSTSATVYVNLMLNSPYLATINNLATPVEKTADKTMKITYILREEM